DCFCRIADNQFSLRKFLFSFYKTQGSNDTFIANFGIVHYYAIHSYQAVSAQICAVDYCTVANVRAFFQNNTFPRKHMNYTVFLYIYTIFQNDFAPVATNRRARTDVTVFADNYISGNGRQRVDETAFVDYGDVVFETENHSGVW